MSYLFSELLQGDSDNRRGPGRRFGPYHLFGALSEISASGRTGRARISKSLGIGEGSARTLLDLLEESSLISRSNAGIVLTDRGRSALASFPVRIVSISRCTLSTGKHTSMGVVTGRSKSVTNGIRQRDEAVKHGGDGAITMVVREGRLLLPPDYGEVRDETVEKAAFGSLGSSDGDAVVIASGSTQPLSQMATFHAAITLL